MVVYECSPDGDVFIKHLFMTNHSITGDPHSTRRGHYSIALAVIAFPLILASIHSPKVEESSQASLFPLAEAEVVTPLRDYVSFNVWVTAYSSSVDETDDTPFVTASGASVEDGIIAANFLPFGTRIIIPELFGDRIFVVQDRMHRRKTNFIDIWMPTKDSAKEFGIYNAEIYIINNDEEPGLIALRG